MKILFLWNRRPGAYPKQVSITGRIFTIVNLAVAFGNLIRPTSAWAQDSQKVLGKMAADYGAISTSGSGLTGGFSAWGIVGGILFGGIGFVAFMYGKKNAEWRPMVLGISLMVYPYFVRGTLLLYLAGIALSAALYFWRE